MYTVTTIHPSGETVRERVPAPLPGDFIKRRLDGAWLELVPHFDQYGGQACVAFCDEEGKLKALAMNPRATYLWYACIVPEPFVPDTLHGPVIIVTSDTPSEMEAL